MNLVEYVVQNRTKSFDELPFSEVDALVFAQISYYNYLLLDKSTYIKDIRKFKDTSIFTSTRNLYPIDTNFFAAVVNSKRYENVLIDNHVNDFDLEYEKQFSATTFYLDKHTCVVAFRGTDGTIVGWKENFNMTYMPVIPSQVEAAAYLNETCEKKNVKKIYVVGHSKGGNLAVYASSRLHEDYLPKIDSVYNFDGPGFGNLFYQTEGFRNIQDKVQKFIPPQSFVGRIMLDDGYKVVKSDDKMLMQHWVYNWIIEDNHLVIIDAPEDVSNSIDITLDEILEEMSLSERRYVVETFYKLFRMNDKMYNDDVLQDKNELLIFAKNFLAVEKDKRSPITNTLWRIFGLFIKNYASDKKYELVKEVDRLKEEGIKQDVQDVIMNLKEKIVAKKKDRDKKEQKIQ